MDQGGHGDGAAALLDPRVRRRAVLAATIGCGIETYDFVTFAFFAIQIGHAFFPSHDRYLSLMGALATFGAGFIGRPIGAWVLGGYGDRVGRKPAMLISMVLMGLAIATLALTPSYAMIGIAAPIIAVVARLVQGFALGAETGASTTYLIEAGDPERRGFSASLQGVSQNVGITCGALAGFVLSLLLSEAQLSDFGWRIALLLGTSVVPFALVIRRTLPETREPESAGNPEPEPFGTAPGPTFRQVVWCGGTIIAASTIATYFVNYTATFGQAELHLSTRGAMAAQVSATAIRVVAGLLGGWLSDRWGRRVMQIYPQIVLVLLIVPAFGWLLSLRSVGVLIAVNLLFSALGGLKEGSVYAAIAESLNPAIRARGFSLIYALPVTIFGGTTQLLLTWLLKVTGTPMSIAWYLAGVQVIGLVAMLLLPESALRQRRARGGPTLAPA